MIADDTKPRVIDWGLSRKITNNDKIPDSHENLVKIFKNMYQKTDNNKSILPFTLEKIKTGIVM